MAKGTTEVYRGGWRFVQGNGDKANQTNHSVRLDWNPWLKVVTVVHDSALNSLRALLRPHPSPLTPHARARYMCQCNFYITQLLISRLGYTHFLLSTFNFPLSTLTVPKSRLLPLLNRFHLLSLHLKSHHICGVKRVFG
ncbi:hypothetical protein VNO78_31088 [Psophocarpus tetragonolobus]|uniref:Uncharacterized protein n=1 Tax=Psophocarpus tetragonolobus TaxID=3891 RepID=A0AAN9RY53_PSOTE